MDFNTLAPLDQTAISVALDFSPKLPVLQYGQSIDHIYLHWEVTGYNACDSAYNATISLNKNGNLWDATINTDPRLNATSPPTEGYAAHTYLRNSHAFGFAVAGMTNATPSDFGPNPITLHEVETFCACAAAVALKYGVDASSASSVMTHGEAAILDGYFLTDQTGDGITRWDLARLSPSANPVTKEECIATGDALRARIHEYKLQLAKHLS
jgi:hypothetical protein